MSTASGTWLPPSVIDEFHVLRSLGQGAMGQVYLGHDTLLDRQVAVKFIASYQPDETARQRFLTEARAIARLQHPNVVTIYRVGEVDGRPFLVSELVRGVSLNDLGKPVPAADVLNMAIEAARGLAAAHRHGVLHRDIKPANMMLTDDGQVKLLDFGLAKFSDGIVPAAGAAPSAPDAGRGAEGVAEGVVGTPLYLAPEVRRGEPATRRSDVYSLGCVLFELCTGRAPLQVALGIPSSSSLTQVIPPASSAGELPVAAAGETGPERLTSDQTEDEDSPSPAEVPEAPPLQRLVVGIDLAFAAVVDRCLHRDPDLRFASGEELWDALEALHTVSAGRIPAGNPYRGLLPFEESHRALFFGRDSETRVVLERLRTEPLLILAGGSGTGKTSLCRAGVLPLCAEGALDSAQRSEAPFIDSAQRWRIVSVTPGPRPMRSLVAALAPLLAMPEEDLLATMATEPAALAHVLRRRRRGEAVLLFIDQLEELFTLTPPAEIGFFGELLGAFDLQGPSVRVLLAIRADFLPKLLSLPGIGAAVARALHLLRPLGAESLREAVVSPAQRCGVRFESDALVGTLVQTAQQTAGGLSLIQFALAELWEARDPSSAIITEASLAALGGVTGALTRHADGVLSSLDQEGRNQARRIFGGLVDRDGQRLHRTRGELCPGEATGAVLEALVRGRLVVASEAAGETAYEIAHDALLQEWTTLREWLDQSAESRAARRRIEAAAAEWERLGRPAEALWRERQMLDVAQVSEADLWPREASFLAASRRAFRRRRRVRLAVLVSLPLLATLTYGGIQLAAHRALERAIGVHIQKALPAQRRGRHIQDEALSAQARALSRFDAGHDAEGEVLWAESQAQLARADEAYALASQELEAALILDSQRAETRRLLSDATFDRALLLEQMHHLQQRDELMLRLPTYDQTGDRLRLLQAPASVDIDTQPPGAQVTLSRFTDGGGFQKQGDLGRTPLRGVNIPQGSWLLSFAVQSTKGDPVSAPTVLPVLLSRGERRALHVNLPPAAAIPAGYVYVPAGDFLYGSADDEALRQGFLHAQPMHRVHVDGFLIGSTEVTLGEWLTFLRALPPAERRLHTPQGSYVHGHLRLRELPDGTYRLSLKPTSTEYIAVEGKPIHYGERTRRQSQDWLRMPVSGISGEDVLAYLSWLDRTGRLPGARLCDEREWEFAARGADGRRFPHGERLLPDDANFDETYGRSAQGFGPDEVGAHPRSQSPFGLKDMVGNVWELTHQAGDARHMVLRGGGWYYDQVTSWTSNRELVGDEPVRDILLGLRVCGPAPRSG